MAALLIEIRQLLSHLESQVSQRTGLSHWMPAPNMLSSQCQKYKWLHSNSQVIGSWYHFGKVSYILTYYYSLKLSHIPMSRKKKKKKKGNIMCFSETSKFTIFATLAEVLILQLFVGDVLEILLIFFSLESLMCTFMPPFIIGLAFFPALPC